MRTILDKLFSMMNLNKRKSLNLLVEVTAQRRVNLLKKEKVNKSGVMGQHMRVGGEITEHMDKVEQFMQMETYMREIGKIIKRMAMEYIQSKME